MNRLSHQLYFQICIDSPGLSKNATLDAEWTECPVVPCRTQLHGNAPVAHATALKETTVILYCLWFIRSQRQILSIDSGLGNSDGIF
jgi:hypothetical protein